MEYELLKAEIVALDDLRIALSHTQKFPDIGGNLDIILADMQRAAKRIHDLVNPDEGGMLVSERGIEIVYKDEQSPKKGDYCWFWDNDITLGIASVYVERSILKHVDIESIVWRNCKVIKKGESNV